MKLNLIPNNHFRILDEILAQEAVTPLSLNPHQPLTTSFTKLGNWIAEKNSDVQLIKLMRDTLERILHTLLQNFPENIFWDFDFFVSSMLRQALVADEGAIRFLESFGDKTVLLLEMFGRKSEIRFRYIHDFIYGFDWARWVQQQPQNRANLEPFCLTFLDYLLSRGQQILQLISVDDARYYRLAEKRYRNPFCFSREPEDERRLLSYLAKQQLIPLATWNWDAKPVWNKPFHQIREQVSLQLNIPRIN